MDIEKFHNRVKKFNYVMRFKFAPNLFLAPSFLMTLVLGMVLMTVHMHVAGARRAITMLVFCIVFGLFAHHKFVRERETKKDHSPPDMMNVRVTSCCKLTPIAIRASCFV